MRRIQRHERALESRYEGSEKGPVERKKGQVRTFHSERVMEVPGTKSTILLRDGDS